MTERHVSPIQRLNLYWRTMRYLESRQLLYLPLRRIQRRLPSLPVRHVGVPNLERLRQIGDCVIAWGPGDAATRVARAREILDGTLRLLNHSERIAGLDWGRRQVSHLWSYNLQYFDYGLDLAWAWRSTAEPRFAERFAELASGWMSANTRVRGDAWDPYVISVRAVNWIYAAALFDDALEESFRSQLWRSIGAQAQVLFRRLEYDIGANHLLRNYRALLVIGLALDGPAAERALKAGSAGLWRELDRQVLSDGGHYERSPMYHAIALGDFLEAYDLCRARGMPLPESAAGTLSEMVAATGALMRPGGDLHFFNDASNGVAPPRGYLDRLAQRVVGKGVPATTGELRLPRTGYYGYSRGPERLLIDCGEPGASSQPGHVHCDLLSFELDIGDRRVIVNSGTSGYGGDPLREYQRSSRAHNTLTIDGQEQSELWGVFRVARRADVVTAESALNEQRWMFSGSYRPFHSATAIHHRSIERVWSQGLTVTDSVSGAQGSDLVSYVHFHPDFRLETNDGVIRATAHDGSRFAVRPFGTRETAIASGWFSPEFGTAIAAPVIELTKRSNDGKPFGYVLSAEPR